MESSLAIHPEPPQKIFVPFNPEIMLLGIHPKELIYNRMKPYLQVLFIIAQNCRGKKSKCTIIDEWLNKFSLWDDRL